MAAVLLATGYGGQVIAQGALVIGGSNATNGQATFSPGSAAVQYNVTAGGGYDARSAGLTDRFDGSPCVGFTNAQPTFILRVTGRIPRLTIAANSGEDTAIIINTASGHWRCNDDTNGNNPSVTMQNTTPGQYDVWVTNYAGGSNAAAQLIIR